MKYAVQLYSLRYYIEENGLEKTFEVIKNAGFKGVEFAGFYGLSAQEIKKLFNKYSLEAVSAHINVYDYKNDLEIIKELGIKTPIISYIDFNGTISIDEGVEKCKNEIVQFKINGLNLGYHNHAHEFKNGRDAIDELVKNIPEILLELDVFWLAVANIKPTNYIKKYKSRLKYLHLKELGESKDDFNPVLGDGNADIAEVIKLGKELSIEWAILEVEKVNMPMAEYLTKCYQFIKNFI